MRVLRSSTLRGAVLVGLLILATVPTTGSTAPDEATFLVGFDELPAELAQGAYADARVERVDPALRFAVVRAGDATSFEARARHDPNVRYVREDDAAAYRATGAPNDPLYAQQWAWPKVNATAAWGITTGSATVRVAVLDSGILREHPDLASGRVLQGYDFVNRDNAPADDCGHGTHVAGTLAATTGNGVGVAGAAQVTVLPVKVLNSYCAGSWSNIASGIRYAADQGARIISMSLSCGVSCYDQAAADAIEYAWTKGALVVVAAGNEGPCEACVGFPASHPRALAVACTDEQDVVCTTSSRGAGTVVAPGRDILSTTRDGGYGTSSGTSMSTPHVSGAAALALSVAPSLTNAQLKSLITSTTVDLGVAGADGTYGYGRLDIGRLAAAAADASQGTPGTTTSGLALSPSSSAATVAKGGTAKHTLTLTNTGGSTQTVKLATSGATGGWKATVSATAATLAPGESMLVTLSVKAPRNAPPGTTATVIVTAAGAGGASASATTTTRVA